MTPRENSVKQLSELYNVVIGVSLSLAITKVVDPDADSIPIRPDILLNFMSFLVTVVPFHQGAVRHLFATYVENGGSGRIKTGALAFDFMLLFFHACIFVALSLVIPNTQLFTNTLMFLLLVDSVWGVLAHLAFTGAQAQIAEKKWALINFTIVVLLFLVSRFGPKLLDGWGNQMQQTIFVICVARTVIDYVLAWSFYYPPRQGFTIKSKPN
jgi:hypothetical protein